MTAGQAGAGDRAAGPLLLAHRGDWSTEAENSLAAFVASTRRAGIDGVEFDVRAALDGTPVVVHDADLRRLHGVDRRVSQLSVAQLRDLDVPDLASVLAVLPDSRFLDVELKEDVAARVVPLLRRVRGEPPRNTIVSSFSTDVIASVRSAAPSWPCWLTSVRLDDGIIAAALRLGCTGVAIEWPALDPLGVALVRGAGLTLATWTLDDQLALERTTGLDVDAICVDPGALP